MCGGITGARKVAALAVVHGSDLVVDHPRPEAGFITVPDAPGIGVRLKPDAEQLRPPLHRKVSMRLLKDGAPHR